MMELEKKIKNIQQSCLEAIEKSRSLETLEAARVEFLGRKGKIANLMPLLKDLTVEEKRIFGPKLNALKQETESAYENKKSQFEKEILSQKEDEQKYFDVTASVPQKNFGSLHPHTLTTQEIEDIFTSMGYHVADGPEVETDYFNFEALNIPKGHPARDMFDTFWIDIPGLLLRTHTSPVQIREMKKKKAPLAIIVPGRVYRYEATDASHDFMFHQVEGLLIGENISLAHLIETMKEFLRTFFKKDTINVRIRPGYFPFVEPGIEFDMSCPFCTKGCSVCKHTQWIEIVGAGLVHPTVLKHGGIDPQTYSGFAFGFGLTRLCMLKYGINDIRLLHGNNVQFLKQF